MKCAKLREIFALALSLLALGWHFSAVAQAGSIGAKLTATLKNDVDGNSRAGTNDTIRYAAALTNNTAQPLSNASVSFPTVTNASLVGGSLRVSTIARADSLWAVSNITLTVNAPGLLANDFLGVPPAAIASFGGGVFGASVSANPSGTTTNAAGVGALTVNADGSVVFAPAPNYLGTNTFQYQLTNSFWTNVAGVTLAVSTLTNRPVASNDSFLVTGNTPLDTSLIPASVMDNDLLYASTLTSVNTNATQGTVAMDFGSGQFTFTPRAGFSGTTAFTYVISNPNGSSTGTVSLVVSNMVWYVDSGSGSAIADGRYNTPFKTLAAFNAVNNGGPGNPGTNNSILLRAKTNPYTNGLVLITGQRLGGEGYSRGVAAGSGFAFAPASHTISPTGLDPVIVNASGHGITLGSSNRIYGVTVSNTPSGHGFFGANIGDLTIAECSKVGTGGAADLTQSGGTANLQFDTLSSSNSTSQGLRLSGLAGTFPAGA